MKRITIILTTLLLLGTLIGISGFQLFKTSLRITVLNELGNIESNAKVAIFKSEEELKKSENPVREGNTDKKGVITFQELEVMPYFISASNGDRNNEGGGEKTETIEEGKLNRITVVISE